ncbi:sensor domain-containing diguanylate cyclase [uncultured Treponema sp.]|uniref:sensor domain-containing diguanylate cyclase n=1 Tax=uncultured Treponema sp. TaxID=162155 RepID=UPI0025FD89C5|nr:sensor domain-containing diguanylate cyclase [uncultured Treponema sp.]
MIRKILFSSLIAVSLLILGTKVSPLKKSKADSKTEIARNKLVAEHIHDELNLVVEKPIIITQTICVDELLKNALKNEKSVSEKDMEALISSYLNSIKEQFGYTAVFVISEKTRRYYTPQGIAKIVNPEVDPYDDWYRFFIDSKEPYKLDTDRNEMYNYRWTVYVNARVTDVDGTLLGVCGVGVLMDELQEIVTAAEKRYGFKVNLINTEGLVQVDSNSNNIESVYISDALKDDASNAAFTYNKNSSDGYRMTRYMSNLDWFLVVQTFSTSVINSGNTIFVIALYVLLSLALLLSLTLIWKAPVHVESQGSELTDSLTGLPNRNYLHESYGEQGIFNTTRYKSLAMFDIDSFKTITEKRDGNKILLGIVDSMKNCVNERGIIFRWADDKFMIFLEMDISEAESKITELCAQIKSALNVTLSVGIVKVDLSESIKTNYHRAVKLCHSVKAEGGNGVFVEK